MKDDTIARASRLETCKREMSRLEWRRTFYVNPSELSLPDQRNPLSTSHIMRLHYLQEDSLSLWRFLMHKVHVHAKRAADERRANPHFQMSRRSDDAIRGRDSPAPSANHPAVIRFAQRFIHTGRMARAPLIHPSRGGFLISREDEGRGCRGKKTRRGGRFR